MRNGVLMLAASLALVAGFAVPANSRSLKGTVLRFENPAAGCLALTSRQDEGWLIRDSSIMGQKHYRLVPGHPNMISLRGGGPSTIDLRPDGSFSEIDSSGTFTGHWSPGESCQ